MAVRSRHIVLERDVKDAWRGETGRLEATTRTQNRVEQGQIKNANEERYAAPRKGAILQWC